MNPYGMPSAPTLHNTCAIIVTCHPDDGFAGRLERVKSQFPLVIIVDNGSRPAAMLRNLDRPPHIHLIENQVNLGLAAALNQGVNLAMLEGYEWVVTLDQDTILAESMLATLLDVYRKSGGGNVMIGSNYRETNRKRNFIRCADAETSFRKRKTLITSGTLAPLSLFKTIGLFREDYFIDSVDHEFSLRARAHGCRILISCRPVMEHSIGAHAEKASRLRQFMSFNHSPARKYYIARNVIATVKSYFLQEPVWSMRQGWRLLSDFASILLFEDEKLKKSTAFMVGLAHGISGRMGYIEKAWPNGPR
ncbi:MAG: glycosyltransferase family 2 protein [Gallionella sp.]|nr:glycosyltransferase family 2 protein [Gallionella sp.]